MVMILSVTTLIPNDYIPLKYHPISKLLICFNPSQSDGAPHSPIDPDDWTLDYVKDAWIQTTCIIRNDDGTKSINPKYTFFRNKLWLDDRIVVPSLRIHEIIEQNHNGILQGHWAVQKQLRFYAASISSKT